MQLINSYTPYTSPNTNKADMAVNSCNDKGVQHKVDHIINMPNEVLQKIAFELYPNDYENLR